MSPAAQKLSDVAMRMMRLSGRPAIRFHRSKASSSSWYTVTSRRSLFRPKPLVTSFHAFSIAVALK